MILRLEFEFTNHLVNLKHRNLVMSKSDEWVELLLAQKKAVVSLNRKLIYLGTMQFLSGLGMLVGIAAVILSQFTGFFGEDKYAVMASAAFMAICAFFSASWHARKIESTKRELDHIKRSITTCPKCGALMLTGSLDCSACHKNSSLNPDRVQKMGFPP